jgi:Fe-S-cluster containining protein
LDVFIRDNTFLSPNKIALFAAVPWNQDAYEKTDTMPGERESMPFLCSQCGTCCMYLGDYIVIERQTGPFEFIGCCVSTGTEFAALIDVDKQELFLDQSWSRNYPSACPFLRPSGDRIVCTIHETSPAQCKAYRCVLFKVLSREERVIGKVTGDLNLQSDDPDLRHIWTEIEKKISRLSDNEEDKIKALLEERGYHCI